MKCFNCGKDIPGDAKACKFCEAPVEDPPTDEEMELAAGILESMDPELQSVIRAAAKNSATAEEFMARMMVGDCPTCGSDDVGDCGEDPEIEHPCLGRCYECGQLWCLDCGELLDQSAVECPHEAICAACELEEACETFPGDCATILQWQAGREG